MRNRNADYFSVGTYLCEGHQRCTMMEQPETARQMLMEDHLLTNDLRVTLTVLLTAGVRSAKGPSAGVVPAPAPQRIALQTVDDRGVSIAHYRTTTQVREVSHWSQPLLVPDSAMRLQLVSQRIDNRRTFAVMFSTQFGLLGQQLLFPASVNPDAATVQRRVYTSAEGGRFWRHRIEMVWLELPDHAAAVGGSREHFFHFLIGYLLPLVHKQKVRAMRSFQVLDCGPLMTPMLE